LWPAEHHFAPGFVAILVGYGTADQHAEQIDRLQAACPPLFDMVTPMPYVALQQMFDEGNHWACTSTERGASLPDLSDGVIEVLFFHRELARRAAPTNMVLMYLMDRAYCAPAEDATAWGGQRTPYWARSSSASTTPRHLAAGRGLGSRHVAAGCIPCPRHRGEYITR